MIPAEAVADRPAEPARRALRPRDAGTLVIVDRAGPEPRILMGRRAPGHVFMAGRYVFPGGRVDPGDVALAAADLVGGPALERLTAGTTSRFDARRAAATALAAIRETFEEVGIRIARPAAEAPPASRHPFWQRFFEGGHVPDTGRLVPFGRAITPPGPPRRFDTRFFAIEGSAEDVAAEFGKRPTDEFDTVGWFGFGEIEALSLAPITRRLLADLRERLADGSWQDARVPMPFYRMQRGRFRRDLL